jgi:hypothetical protein
LALCAGAGLVSGGVVALDSTAMAANASQEATRAYPAVLAEVDRVLAEAQQAGVEAAHAENVRWRADGEAEHGRKLGDRKPFAPDPDALAKRSINTTGPDSRKIARAGKTVQGYNAQAGATAGQIILAADLTQQSNDSGQLTPMITSTLDNSRRSVPTNASGRGWPTGGYWNSPQIAALGQAGMTVIVPVKSSTANANT